MFLLIGGIAGFGLALFLFVGPAALSLALALGTAAVWPFQAFSSVVSVGFFGGLIIHLIVTLILYAIAAIATPPVQGAVPTNPIEELCRGAQIGINSCANFLYTAALYPAAALAFGGPPAGVLAATLAPFFGLALCIVNFACVFPSLSRDASFEAVLGWSGWFMPMSWPLQILGLIAFAVGAVAWLFGRPFAALGDWWPGTVVRHGWLFDFGGAFTLGNFTVVSGDLSRVSPRIVQGQGGPLVGFDSALGIVSHELGHTLVAAGFGFLFSAVGWVHERFVDLTTGLGGRAYFEFLCEGIRRRTGGPPVPDARPWIAMWAPPVALSGPGGGNARIALAATIAGVPANPAVPVPITVGVPADLDASATIDPDDFPMGTVSGGATPSVGFRWALIVRPPGSNAAIPSPTSATTTFTADVAGDYRVTLAATDGSEGALVSVDLIA